MPDPELEESRPAYWGWLFAATATCVLAYVGYIVDEEPYRERQAITSLERLDRPSNSLHPRSSSLQSRNGTPTGESSVTMVSVGPGANGSGVIDAHLQRYAEMTSLESLNLRDSRISDDGLSQLRTLTQLKTLGLSGAPITDAGLAHLSGLTQLKILDLRRTKVTAAGIANLKKVLPDCVIIRPRA